MINPFVILVTLVGVPLLELFLLIKVGALIGAIPTIALVVFTAVLGGLLVHHQGLSTLQRAQRQMEAGGLPAVEMLEGVVLLIGGFLLLLPGFLTDLLGLLSLVPPLRRALILRWLGGRPPGPPGSAGGPPGQRTIEGEYWREK